MSELPHTERRSIPVETLNYISVAIHEGFESIKETMMTKQEFSAHDHAELVRYDQILKNQKANAEEARDRDDDIKRSLDA